MKEVEYDLVSIGGGTAGLVSAAGAQYLGARAGLIERTALGGDCLWTGCVPSKALIASARVAHGMRRADALGLQTAAPEHAFEQVMERMRAARDRVAHHDDPERFRDMGVGVHFGSAHFVGRDVIEVEGVGRIRSRRFVVATGAEPWIPPIPGLEETGYLTHATAFDQTHLPARMMIVGAGPIGLEFAQIYARLGADVSVVDLADRILPREDEDVAGTVKEVLELEGIHFRLGTRTEEAGRDQAGKFLITGEGESLRADEIFVATGRRPLTSELRLDRAGVEMANGAVVVDDTLRTSNRGVWGCGDVTGGAQFTHVADHMAKVVVRNALLPFSSKVDYSVVPRVTFTDPEVAHVGLGEDGARARGARTYRYDLSDLDRAICDGQTAGFVKIHADRRGKVLGATVLAHGAGEMIMPLVLAMRHGLSLGAVTNTIFPYPTMGEGVLRAAQQFRREQLDTIGGRLLQRVVKWLA